VYDRERCLAAVGFAANRAGAEQKAFAALTALFGQAVRAAFSASGSYSETRSGGGSAVSETTRVQDQVLTSTALDTLVGAEIGRVWDDGQGTVYAAAYLDREKTAAQYTGMIQGNLWIIEGLSAPSAGKKNSFEGYARFRLAARIAALNLRYAAVVSQAAPPGSASSGTVPELKGPGFYDLEAAAILKSITVAVSVEGDRRNRIRDAFAGALSAEGLRTRGTNPPYGLEVSLDLGETAFPNNPDRFCRYGLSASLVDLETGAILLPFTLSGRTGHRSYEGAENLALLEMERRVKEAYSPALKEYLAALASPDYAGVLGGGAPPWINAGRFYREFTFPPETKQIFFSKECL
jgi:hypothetical protein